MKEKQAKSKQVDPFQVIRENDAWVRRLARGLVFDQNEAEDVVQQTWLALFQRPPLQEGNLHGWIRTVLTNSVRKLRRSNRNRKKRETVNARSETIEHEGPSEADRLVLLAEIRSAVEALEEPYRSAIKLKYLEEMSPADIAKKLDIPILTVYTQLTRGARRLRAKLDKKYGNRKAWTVVAMPWLRLPNKLWISRSLAAGVAALAIAAPVALLAMPGPDSRNDKISVIEETPGRSVVGEETRLRLPIGDPSADRSGLHKASAQQSKPSPREESFQDRPSGDGISSAMTAPWALKPKAGVQFSFGGGSKKSGEIPQSKIGQQKANDRSPATIGMLAPKGSKKP